MRPLQLFWPAVVGASLTAWLAWRSGCPGWLAWVSALSVTTLLVFAIDKHAARHGRRRVSEKQLLTLALLGGSPGAFAAMSLFRHKTLKRPFRWRMAAVTAGQLLGVALWLARNRL